MSRVGLFHTIFLAITLLVSCGRSDDNASQAPQADPRSSDLLAEDAQKTSSVEADFAGYVSFDAQGNCNVTGNDVDLVNCEVLQSNSDGNEVSVNYTDLKLETAPVCNVNFVGSGALNENIESINKSTLVVRVSKQKEGSVDPTPPNFPPMVLPDPIVPRPPVGVCTPGYGGPGCINCCGSSYAGVGFNGSSVAAYNQNMPEKQLPTIFMFQCKILW